jgi:pimeloyl-ACP methyl ester carboxylesterase
MAEPPPERPRRERLSFFLFRLLAPRVPRIEPPEPPESLRPWETVTVPRPARPHLPGREDAGPLEGTWYPAGDRPGGGARGAVLLVHPWLEWGRAYFHRRGRIEALRRAGYHVLAVDLSGFGGSGEPRGYYDLDCEDALARLTDLARPAGSTADLPLHVWGVSSGGYWLHPALVRWNRDARSEGPDGPGRPPVLGAMFEDVSIHLLEWTWRKVPLARPFLLAFRALLPATGRFLDLRRHAPHLGTASVAYVSGALDRGVPPACTRELAERAGGMARIVPEAGHLESIKVSGDEVLALALDTFERAESAAPASGVAPA